MIGGLALLARIDVNSGDNIYVPAQIIDGQFIPGGYRPADGQSPAQTEGATRSNTGGATGGDNEEASGSASGGAAPSSP